MVEQETELIILERIANIGPMDKKSKDVMHNVARAFFVIITRKYARALHREKLKHKRYNKSRHDTSPLCHHL
jgi:hypothetical protein